MSDITENIVAVRHEQQDTQARLAVLEAKATSYLLTHDEVTEQLTLERYQSQLEGKMAALRSQEAAEKDLIAIDEVVAAWGPLVERKLDAYRAVSQKMAELGAALDYVRAVHAQQEAMIAELPRTIAQQLSFPDANLQMLRVAGRLPGDLRGVVNARPLTHGEFADVCDVDVGTRDINPRVLERFVEASPQWKIPRV